MKIFPFHALLVPKTKKGKKKGFKTGKFAQHMLISSTDSTLNMFRSVILRKKTCNYSLIPILYDSKKRKTRVIVIFCDRNIYLWIETKYFVRTNQAKAKK